MKLLSLGLEYVREGRESELRLLDQQLLPDREEWIAIRSPEEMIAAIRALKVRGAPLIGVAAALALADHAARGTTEAGIRREAAALREARPTAVNLMWAIDRMLAVRPLGPGPLLAEARAIFEEDMELCARMAENGAALIADGDRVLTHCNTGGLATAGVGTALGVIRRAHESGKRIHVLVDETRPLLQGGRLTAWELERLGIPYTLICDNMAASLMRAGGVTKAIVGADRIAANGDFANKVGTYGVAVLARHHAIPFYVAAPCSTVDLGCPSAESIPVELRSEAEVRGARGSFGEVRWSPERAPAWNPAFDVTPSELVSAYVLDRGVIEGARLRDATLAEILR